jgi:hypothetical protein
VIMADQVTIPGTHAKVSRNVAIGGVLVTGTLIAVYYVRKRNSAATPAPASTASQYPPDGTVGNPSDPYSTDPATNQTYGNEAAGSGGQYGAYGTGAASGMYYDPATGAYDLTSPYGTSAATQPYQTQGGPPFSSNSAWSDWVIQELQAQNPVLDVGALTDSIGLYLGGQPLNATQRQYVFDARAVAGDPPVAGASGYPPNVRGDGSTGGNPGPKPAPTVTVPNVVGYNYGHAYNVLVYGNGFKIEPTGVNSHWDVTAQSPKAGTKAAKGSVVTLTVKAVKATRS